MPTFNSRPNKYASGGGGGQAQYGGETDDDIAMLEKVGTGTPPI